MRRTQLPRDLLLHELLNGWLELRGVILRVDALPYEADAKRSVAAPSQLEYTNRR
jgi:hypothetical protein